MEHPLDFCVNCGNEICWGGDNWVHLIPGGDIGCPTSGAAATPSNPEVREHYDKILASRY